MPENDPALKYIKEQLDEVKADGKETRAIVSDMASRDRADLLRFEQHDKRISRIESAGFWLIGLIIAAVLGAVLKVTGL